MTATTADGVALALRRHRAAGERRGVLLCTHAMMANGSYFAGRDDAGFAAHLAAAGIDVYVLDWRGHGASRPPHPRRDAWSFDDYVELDLPAALAAVCADAGVGIAELTYLGHSLGGLAGLAGFGTGAAPVPGRITLWATSVWLPGARGPRTRRWAMAAYALASRALGYAPIRRLGIGSDDETRGYVEQLAGWARRGAWTSRTGVDYLAALADIDAPVWPVVGEGDRLCVAADAAVIAERLRGASPLRRVGTAFGDAADPDHFGLFRDRRLAPLWDELAAFVAGA